jgi:hypothetical protein
VICPACERSVKVVGEHLDPNRDPKNSPHLPFYVCEWPDVDKPGYHLRKISKGTLGELSKIQEELDELRDAEEQGVKVMQLVEASDMVGALVRWLESKHPGTTLDDLIEMHKVTRRAFENGRR